MIQEMTGKPNVIKGPKRRESMETTDGRGKVLNQEEIRKRKMAQVKQFEDQL